MSHQPPQDAMPTPCANLFGVRACAPQEDLAGLHQTNYLHTSSLTATHSFHPVHIWLADVLGM